MGNPSSWYFTCPVCGADVPRNAKACPECGACEKSGWGKDMNYDGLDLPDDDFDYDAFIEEEFKDKPKSTVHPGWIITGGVLLVAFILYSISGF